MRDEGFEGVGGPAVYFNGVCGAAEGEEVVGEGVAAGYIERVGPDGEHDSRRVWACSVLLREAGV